MSSLCEEQKSPRSEKLAELLSEPASPPVAGENLLSEAQPGTPEPAPEVFEENWTASQLKERYPIISRFVVEFNPDRMELSDEELRAKLDADFEQTIVNTGDVYTQMVKIQKEIDKKRARLEEKIADLEGDSTKTPKMRAAQLITIEMRPRGEPDEGGED